MSWQTCSHRRGRRGIDFKVNVKLAQCGKSAQMALRSAELLRSGGNRIGHYREASIQKENGNGNAACTTTVIGVFDSPIKKSTRLWYRAHKAGDRADPKLPRHFTPSNPPSTYHRRHLQHLTPHHLMVHHLTPHVPILRLQSAIPTRSRRCTSKT